MQPHPTAKYLRAAPGSPQGRTLNLGGANDDAPVRQQREARVVGDFPDVAVEIAKTTRVAPVEGLSGLAGDDRARRTSLLDDLVDLLA